MAGYKNYSMSWNAVEAYQDGEKPMSKWTKDEILRAVRNECDEYADKVELLKMLTAAELKSLLLVRSSWHHTSKFYNRTIFYEIDFDNVEELTEEQVNNIISHREPRIKRTAKIVEKPTYITAYVIYDEWEGSRNHPRKVEKREIVQYMSNQKMVRCYKSNSWEKRLSSLYIKYKIEQKTKFATKEQLIKKFKIEEY